MNNDTIKLEELPEIKFLIVGNKVFPISEEITDKVNLLTLMESSYRNLEDNGPGFISYLGESRYGEYIRLNKEGIDYFKQNILPLINPKTKAHVFDRYEDKLHGDGQRSDISEDGFIYGKKHIPSILEQNYFECPESFVSVPLPDEVFLGARGETAKINDDGRAVMKDTHDFVMRNYNN